MGIIAANFAARNVVDEAKAELKEWRDRYEEVRQYFQPVFQAIAKIA